MTHNIIIVFNNKEMAEQYRPLSYVYVMNSMNILSDDIQCDSYI